MKLLKVGTANSHFIYKYGYKDGLKKVRECGFDSIDFSFFAYQTDADFVLKKNDNDLKTFFKQLKTIADDVGLEFGQTHAPYYNYLPLEQLCGNEYLNLFINSIKSTAYLGSKYLVIHPAIFRDAENNYMRSFDANIKFFGLLKSVAKDFGVTIAVENLCAINPLREMGVPSATSSGEKLSHLVDALGDGFCACLDTGHAFFTGQDPAQFARLLSDRLKVLHIQDGDGYDDMHVPPTLGHINWQDFLSALKEINYQGVLNMEISYRRFGGYNNLMETGKFLSEIGRDFAKQIGKMEGE